MQTPLIIASTTLLVLFGVQNSDHVAVTFIVGSPVEVRLIFLLLTATAAGYLASYIRELGRERRLKLETKRLTALRQTALAKLALLQDDE